MSRVGGIQTLLFMLVNEKCYKFAIFAILYLLWFWCCFFVDVFCGACGDEVSGAWRDVCAGVPVEGCGVVDGGEVCAGVGGDVRRLDDAGVWASGEGAGVVDGVCGLGGVDVYEGEEVRGVFRQGCFGACEGDVPEVDEGDGDAGDGGDDGAQGGCGGFFRDGGEDGFVDDGDGAVVVVVCKDEQAGVVVQEVDEVGGVWVWGGEHGGGRVGGEIEDARCKMLGAEE